MHLDDGTARLWAIRDRGGVAVVQNPSDAAVSSMPMSALTEAGADHVVMGSEIGPLLVALARMEVPRDAPEQAASSNGPQLEREVGMAALDEDAHERVERSGVPSRFSCPDCGGVLWDVSRGGLQHYRCETGHAFSAASLAEARRETLEGTLWAALRALEDKVALSKTRVETAQRHGVPSAARRFAIEMHEAQEHAATLRALLRTGAGRVEEPR